MPDQVKVDRIPSGARRLSRGDTVVESYTGGISEESIIGENCHRRLPGLAALAAAVTASSSTSQASLRVLQVEKRSAIFENAYRTVELI